MQAEKADEVRAWLAKVVLDLRCADLAMAASPSIVEDALFHCQQAVEKALKGFLTAHDRPFRKTHDLDEVGRACEEIDPALRDVLVPARDLSVFAWLFRYPMDVESPSREEAVQALALARRVVDAVLSRLPDEVRPSDMP